MSNFIKVAPLTDIKPNKMYRAKIKNHSILLAHIENKIYAIDDVCTHEDASLYNGALKGFCVECPLHGSHFDFRNGEPQQEPATKALQTYPVKIENDEIYISLNN